MLNKGDIESEQSGREGEEREDSSFELSQLEDNGDVKILTMIFLRLLTYCSLIITWLRCLIRDQIQQLLQLYLYSLKE